MSRSGYSDDYEYMDLYRGTVDRAIKGKRGQIFLRELRDALDSMPEKRLIADELRTSNGEVCALGALGEQRGIDLGGVDPEDTERLADIFNIARCLAAETVYMNDEYYGRLSPENRWQKMRQWVEEGLRKESPEP